MDKYEYKLRAEEIRELVKERRYQEALTIVEKIDWNRVRGASMLTIASEVYKANRRYEESREILLLAYERHPGKRSIIFSLCELCLKMGDFIAAVKYYKEFVKVATKDSRRFILQYKIYESQDVSLEERIAVLEEYKKHDYRERWAYELAYLYHRVGLATRCVEECDELIVWFGEGKYVKKAMELKMLHQPLSSVQETKYLRMNRENQKTPVSQQTDELDIQVKTMDMSKYNTINLQQELAECMQEFMRVTEDAEQENKKTENMQKSIDKITELQSKKVETETFFEPKEENGYKEGSPDESKMKPIIEQAPKQETEQTIEKVLDTGMKEFVAQEEIQDELVHKEHQGPEIDRMLHQGYDGQISLVVPENKQEVQEDLQITGQLCIKDILIEWERMKKENEEKRKDDVRKHVMEQTCDMFSEFDAATKAEIKADLKRLAAGITSPDYVPDTEETEVMEEKVLDLTSYKEEALEVENSLTEETSEVPEEVTEEVIEEDEMAGISVADGMTEVVGETLVSDGMTEVVAEIPASDEMEEVEEVEENPASDDIIEEVENPASDNIIEEVENPVAEVMPEVVEEILAANEMEEAVEETDEELFDEEETEEIIEELEEQTIERTEKCSDVTKAFMSERDTKNFQKEVQKELKKQESTKKKDKSLQLTTEERKLFGAFVQTKESKRQILRMVEVISLAAETGNVIVTGEIEKRSFELSKCVIKQLQLTDGSFSGKVAKINAGVLREKGFSKTFDRLKNGAIIVEHAGMLKKEDVVALRQALQRAENGILIVLVDTDRAINRLITRNECMLNEFNARIDITELDNDSLVAYGTEYALENEYSIDDMGTLALYSRIADMQTCIHAVDTKEVEEIVKEAIESAMSKKPKHFFQVLFNTRYDEEDRIILREKNFLLY